MITHATSERNVFQPSNAERNDMTGLSQGGAAARIAFSPEFLILLTIVQHIMNF